MNYMVHFQTHNSVNADIDKLIRDLHSEDGLVRRRARQALVDKGPAAVPALRRELQAPMDYTRWEAAKALCEIHAPEVASDLVSRLEDDAFSVRWLAAEALIALNQDALQPLLQALVRQPDSAWLRSGAHHVLRVLEKERHNRLLLPVIKALECFDPSLEAPIAAENALRELEQVH